MPPHPFGRRGVGLETVGPTPQQLKAAAVPHHRVERGQQPHRAGCAPSRMPGVFVRRPIPVHTRHAGLCQPGLGTGQRGLAQTPPLGSRVPQHAHQLAQAGGRQGGIGLYQRIGHRVHRGLGVGGFRPGRCHGVAAGAAVAPHHIQQPPVVQAVEQTGGQAALPAKPVDGHPVLQRRIHLSGMRPAQPPDLRQHPVGLCPACIIPRLGGGARMHQRPQLRHQKSVVDEKIFLHSQRRIPPLQVTGAVAAHPVAQRQVLRPGGHPQRIGLHKAAHLPDSLHQTRRGKQAACHRVAAQVIQAHVHGHVAKKLTASFTSLCSTSPMRFPVQAMASVSGLKRATLPMRGIGRHSCLERARLNCVSLGQAPEAPSRARWQ